jgi:putative NIF3 family GTP cyclohydrolase 1 type 2
MPLLTTITKLLDELFAIDRVDADPAFSHFVPWAYDPIGVDWRSYFEPEFNVRFNGLMMRGAAEVGTVYCAVFPSDVVLDRFIEQANPGDLFFSHHALDMRMGDPRRKSETAAFLPIPVTRLQAMRDKRLSYYSCHIPMDLTWTIGTTASIAQLLGATIVDHFDFGEFGPYGAICEIEPRSTDSLIAEIDKGFVSPYAESLGPKQAQLTRISIRAGAGIRAADYEV